MTAQEEPEPVYARLPMCPRCRWRKSDDAGSELEVFQRRRCLKCDHVFRLPPIAWIVWAPDGSPVTVRL